jgi:hypothetical protein
MIGVLVSVGIMVGVAGTGSLMGLGEWRVGISKATGI